MPPTPLPHRTGRQETSLAQNPQIPSPTTTENTSCTYAMPQTYPLQTHGSPGRTYANGYGTAPMAKPARPLITSLSPVTENQRPSEEGLTNWNLFLSTINQAVGDSIGRTRCTPMHPWISPSTLEIIELAEPHVLGMT